MRHPPQACLNASKDHRRLFIGSPNQVGIYYRRVIRPLSGGSSRRIGVMLSSLFVYGVMVHHGIHIPAAHQKSQPRFPQNSNAGVIPPIRLGNNPNPVTVGFQMPAYNRHTKG